MAFEPNFKKKYPMLLLDNGDEKIKVWIQSIDINDQMGLTLAAETMVVEKTPVAVDAFGVAQRQVLFNAIVDESGNHMAEDIFDDFIKYIGPNNRKLIIQRSQELKEVDPSKKKSLSQ